MSNFLRILGVGAAGGALAVLILGSLVFFYIKQDLIGWLFAIGAFLYVVAGAIALIMRALHR